MTRRDLCALVGRRAARIVDDTEAAKAWRTLSAAVEELAERDVPKFRDLIDAIRKATIAVKNL